jgi:hypothetical protein
LSLLA